MSRDAKWTVIFIKAKIAVMSKQVGSTPNTAFHLGAGKIRAIWACLHCVSSMKTLLQAIRVLAGMGNVEHIPAGEWQLMSAGTGVQHSEMNSTDQPVHLLQIWLYPNVQNAEPTYQQISLDPREQPNQWHHIVSPTQDTPLFIRQDANISAAYLHEGKTLTLEPQKALNYLHVIEGKVRVNDEVVQTGDAIVFEGKADIIADTDAHLLWFDLPAKA